MSRVVEQGLVKKDIVPPGLVSTAWLIARRAAMESLRDRSTLVLGLLIAVAVPTFFALAVIRPAAISADTIKKQIDLGAMMAFYLLVVGLGPATNASSVASGVFAGEMEKGNLAPLLATPASNFAIFAGKVFGSVLPALLYTVIAEAMYLAEIGATAGPNGLHLMPLSLVLALLLLVPAISLLGATVASLISSRTRTYTGAQTISSFLLVPIMGCLVALALAMRFWGPWWPFAPVAAVYALDALLIGRGAATWRREEVMARR